MQSIRLKILYILFCGFLGAVSSRVLYDAGMTSLVWRLIVVGVVALVFGLGAQELEKRYGWINTEPRTGPDEDGYEAIRLARFRINGDWGDEGEGPGPAADLLPSRGEGPELRIPGAVIDQSNTPHRLLRVGGRYRIRERR